MLDQAKGGVASAWMLHEMTARNLAPLALLLNFANPVMAQEAAFAALTLIDRFETDITQAIPNDARLEVDPAAGLVTIVTG